MLAVARNRRRVVAAAAIPRSSPYGSRAVATSSEADQQEREKKSKWKSTWTNIKWFLPPAIFFCVGTERLNKLLEVSELAKQCKKSLKLEVEGVSEIHEFSRESLKCKEFRKVKCRGVFDESKSILVLVNSPTRFHPFAYQYSLLTPFIPDPQR